MRDGFLLVTGCDLDDEFVASALVVSVVLHPAGERAGVAWVSFHTLRHTCASLLFAGGKNVKQVQAWLGHADPGFTVRTYIHLMDEGVGEADFLDDVVGGGRTIA